MNSEDVFELRNVDPEDVSDVLAKIEKSFDFQFGNGEPEDVNTFGELCDVIIGKVQGEHTNDCTTQQAFYKLRTAFAKITFSNTQRIAPGTELCTLLPKQSRRKKIKMLEEELGLTLNLVRPRHWITHTVIFLFLASFICLFIQWKIGVSGLATFIAAVFIANKTANEIDAQTLRQLTKKFVREHYRKSRSNTATINRNEIAEQIKLLFAEDLHLDASVLHRAATFN